MKYAIQLQLLCILFFVKMQLERNFIIFLLSAIAPRNFRCTFKAFVTFKRRCCGLQNFESFTDFTEI